MSAVHIGFGPCGKLKLEVVTEYYEPVEGHLSFSQLRDLKKVESLLIFARNSLTILS